MLLIIAVSRFDQGVDSRSSRNWIHRFNTALIRLIEAFFSFCELPCVVGQKAGRACAQPRKPEGLHYVRYRSLGVSSPEPPLPPVHR